MDELSFISGNYLLNSKDDPLPKQYQFLYRYFKTDYQKAFLKYWFVFRPDMKRFENISGIRGDKKALSRLRIRFEFLYAAIAEARKDNDFEKVAEIESGKMRHKDIWQHFKEKPTI